jgi:hypothetical protein
MNNRTLARAVAAAVTKANVSGPQDDWPNTSPAPQSPARQRLYQQDIKRRQQQDREARARADQLRRQQEAFTASRRREDERDPTINPTPDNGRVSVNSDMNLEQYTPAPAVGDDGRAAAAKVIRSLHKGQRTAGLLKGEGDRLRKAALGQIDLSPADLSKMVRKFREASKAGRLRDALNSFVDAAQEAGLAKVGDVELRRRAPNGVGTYASINAIKRVHAVGPRQLQKGASMPPESSNSTWNDNRANDGADLAHDSVVGDRSGLAPSQRLTPFSSPNEVRHDDSQQSRGGRPMPTQDNSNKTLEAIKEAQRNPIPLMPGTLGGNPQQNPNRDDAKR